MGKHKDWRRIAKRERRRRIRKFHAKLEDSENSASCQEEQEMLELIYEQINLSNKLENEKWIQAEGIALENWKKIENEKERVLEELLEKERRLRIEWEQELEKKKGEIEKLKQIEEENKKKQQDFMENLQKFLSGDSCDPPPELVGIRESRPNTEPCPFFVKTACCRFGDQCSRNHQYPIISKVLLAANFYTHFGLENTFHNNEYDTDIMLEYEDSETYREFRDFFYDVILEFEKFGKIVQFKVCNNYEKHLRGNTYVEYAELRSAVAAYKHLHARWYGGKQLSLQFCTIQSWKNAICGLQLRKRCPKGRGCNFLHIYRNPNNLFARYNTSVVTEHRRPTPSRSWRWSESPEPEPRRSSRKSSEHRREERKREDHKHKHKHKSRRSDR